MERIVTERMLTMEDLKPEPIGNRFGVRTYIWCVDSINPRFIVEPIRTIEKGTFAHCFFFINRENVVNVAANIEEWETGLSVFLKKDSTNMGTVGTRLVVRDGDKFIVYKIKGFNNNDDSSSVYFDLI